MEKCCKEEAKIVAGGDLADKITNGDVLVMSETISQEIVKDEFDAQIDVLHETQKKVIGEVNSFIEFFTNSANFFWISEDRLLKNFINFLINEMPWKYNEAIFLQGLIFELKILKKQSPANKKSGYYISNKLIETINFMLQKIEGKGIKVNGSSLLSFEKFIELFEATQESLRLTEGSKKAVQFIEKNINGEIDYRIQSLEHGVSTEGLSPILEVSTVLPKLEIFNDVIVEFEPNKESCSGTCNKENCECKEEQNEVPSKKTKSKKTKSK